MGIIVVVCGLPGTGKTFFARKLAEKMQAVHISSDSVRKEMVTSAHYTMKDKLNVYSRMASLSARQLLAGKNVVVDATFHHHIMREIFVRLSLEQSATIRFIKLEADESVIKERISKPRTDSDAGLTVYEKLKSQYEPLLIPHLTLKSENNNAEQMVKDAVTYIEQS